MADTLPKLGVMLQSAKELTLEAANAVSARLMDDGVSSPEYISSALMSSSDREKLSGLKQLISMISMGNTKDIAKFFPQVVKNVASENVEIRKLVYVFLVRFADYDPDLALLSINTIQKALKDKSAVIRSLAMRVISSIRVPSIAQIVILGIKDCANDLSPLVRKAAAFAIYKCNELDHSNGPKLLEILQKLLSDNSPVVVSAAIVTLQRAFFERFDVLHSCYRRICRILSKLDEWGQIAALELLTKYARTYLEKPQKLRAVDRHQDDEFYNSVQYEPLDDSEDEYEENANINGQESNEVVQTIIDPDCELLFLHSKPLLRSTNSAVVINAAQVYFYLGNAQIFEQYNVAGSVVQLLKRESVSIRYIALVNMKIMILTRKSAFSPFLKHFFLFPNDVSIISKLKLEILSLLYGNGNETLILSELKYYALTSKDTQTVRECVQAIGRCVSATENPDDILNWLSSKVKSSDSALVSECLTVIRYIILKDPKRYINTIKRLAMLLEKVVVDSGKETILWLVGEFAGYTETVAPDLLRKFAKLFALESPGVRYQVVLLAAKVYSYHIDKNKFNAEDEDELSTNTGPIPKLFSYIMLLARYDSNYDIRDRARMFSTLLTSSISTDLATLLLQAPKPNPITSLREIMIGKNSSSNATPIVDLTLGSNSLTLGHPVDGFITLPQWSDKKSPYKVDPSVRDETTFSPQTVVRSISSTTANRAKNQTGEIGFGSNLAPPVAPKKTNVQTLDEFFADVGPSNKISNEEESSEEDDSSEDTEDSESDEDESEDEGSDGSEDESEGEQSGESEGESSEEESEEDEKSNLLQN